MPKMTTIVIKDNNKKEDYESPSKGGEVNLLKALSRSFHRNSSRIFTLISMSYVTAFDRLNSKSALFPIGPTLYPEEDIKGPRWDNNSYCK